MNAPLTAETPRLRDLRQKQERAHDWVIYASWVAMGYAAISVIVMFTAPLDLGQVRQVSLVYLASAALQGALGYLMRGASLYAAWGLLAVFLLEVAYSVATDTPHFDIMWLIAIGFMYLRGAFAAVVYHDQADLIAQRVAEESPQ